MKIRNWIIKKLVGDRLVILNAAIIYKHYPIFADIEENPLIDCNIIIEHEVASPFQIYGASIFEIGNEELKFKDKYKESYNTAVQDIITKLGEAHKEVEKYSGD